MKAFIVGLSLVAITAAPCFGGNCPRRRNCVKQVKVVKQVVAVQQVAYPVYVPQYQVGSGIREEAIAQRAAELAVQQYAVGEQARFRAALQGRICVEFGSDGSATVHPAPNGHAPPPSGPPNGDLPPPPDGNNGPPPPPGDEPGPPNGDSAAIWQKAQAVADATCVRCHTPGAAKYAEHELDLRDLRTVPCDRLGLAVHRAWVGTMPPGLPEGQGIPEEDAAALFELLKVMGSNRDQSSIQYREPPRVVALPSIGTPTTPDVWAQMRGLPKVGGREPNFVYESDTGQWLRNDDGDGPLVPISAEEALAAGLRAPPNP